MAFTFPKGQPITLNPEFCQEDCVVYSNRTSCGDVLDNELFEGAASEWTISGATKVGEDPYTLSGSLAVYSVSQSITLQGGNKYVIKYAYRAGTTHAGIDLNLTAWGDGIVGVAYTDTRIVGEYEYTPTNTATGTFTVSFNYGSLAKQTTILYIKICPVEGTVEDYDCPELCFKAIPGYEDPIVDKDIDFTLDFQDDLASFSYSSTDPSPFTNTSAIFPTLGTITDTGNHWVAGRFLGNILFCKNSNDELNKANYLINGVEYDEFILSNGNQELGRSISFTTSDTVDTEAYSKSIDADISIINYTLNNIETAVIQMFSEEIVDFDTGFYRISFNLAKTTGVTVKIYNPSATLVHESRSTLQTFDKLIEIETSGNHTIRFEVDDFVYQALTDFDEVGTGALTDLQISRQCGLTAELNTSDLDFLTQIDTIYTGTSETVGFSYAEDVEFCFNLDTLDLGSYVIVLRDDCNIYKVNYSNCFTVCSNATNLLNISYNQDVNVGGYDMNYTNCLWLKGSFMDPVIQDTREVYQYSNGFMAIPYVFNRSVEVLQLYPISKFVRESLAIALMGTIQIDGEDYQKIEDEDISIIHRFKHESPIRILLHKVGDFAHTIN